VDHSWAAAKLQEFADLIEQFSRLDDLVSMTPGQTLDEANSRLGSHRAAGDRLVMIDPIMRELMEAARPGLGDYPEPPSGGWSASDPAYWQNIVRDRALRAIGVHELSAEARERMRPDSPDLVADRFHPWVWEAAAPLWAAGSTQEAVHAAARSVNARLQQKVGRRDRSEAALCREAFSLKDAAPGAPRLRFLGDRTSDTWRSRQQGGIDFGAGCFEGIRNPAAHEDDLDLNEQVALEQLAALSVLARWIEECAPEVAGSPNAAAGPSISPP